MPENKEQTILQKMMQIGELIEQGKQNENTQVGTIHYYKDFIFQGSNLAETDIFVAKIENTADNSNTYEIYAGKTNTLIATVNEQGKLRFMPEYIENLRQIDEKMVQMLQLEDLDFELPKELAKEDRILTKEESQQMIGKNEEIGKEDKIKGIKNREEFQPEKGEKSLEEEQKEQIAKIKKIPSHSILMIRPDSNFYKDHPNLEPNLYFYRDNQGVVRAEYIDSNGQPQPSKYFEPSTEVLRQETISIGDDGKTITKEVPYQVMKTKGLNHVDKDIRDIRDIRINIKIDTYGYLDIEEARQGKNGEWLSHDIEVKGRDYNAQAVNDTTSIRTRNADPDKQTEAYEREEGRTPWGDAEERRHRR